MFASGSDSKTASSTSRASHSSMASIAGSCRTRRYARRRQPSPQPQRDSSSAAGSSLVDRGSLKLFRASCSSFGAADRQDDGQSITSGGGRAPRAAAEAAMTADTDAPWPADGTQSAFPNDVTRTEVHSRATAAAAAATQTSQPVVFPSVATPQSAESILSATTVTALTSRGSFAFGSDDTGGAGSGTGGSLGRSDPVLGNASLRALRRQDSSPRDGKHGVGDPLVPLHSTVAALTNSISLGTVASPTQLQQQQQQQPGHAMLRPPVWLRHNMANLPSAFNVSISNSIPAVVPSPRAGDASGKLHSSDDGGDRRKQGKTEGVRTRAVHSENETRGAQAAAVLPAAGGDGVSDMVAPHPDAPQRHPIVSQRTSLRTSQEQHETDCDGGWMAGPLTPKAAVPSPFEVHLARCQAMSSPHHTRARAQPLSQHCPQEQGSGRGGVHPQAVPMGVAVPSMKRNAKAASQDTTVHKDLAVVVPVRSRDLNVEATPSAPQDNTMRVPGHEVHAHSESPSHQPLGEEKKTYRPRDSEPTTPQMDVEQEWEGRSPTALLPPTALTFTSRLGNHAAPNPATHREEDPSIKESDTAREGDEGDEGCAAKERPPRATGKPLAPITLTLPVPHVVKATTHAVPKAGTHADASPLHDGDVLTSTGAGKPPFASFGVGSSSAASSRHTSCDSSTSTGSAFPCKGGARRVSAESMVDSLLGGEGSTPTLGIDDAPPGLLRYFKSLSATNSRYSDSNVNVHDAEEGASSRGDGSPLGKIDEGTEAGHGAGHEEVGRVSAKALVEHPSSTAPCPCDGSIEGPMGRHAVEGQDVLAPAIASENEGNGTNEAQDAARSPETCLAQEGGGPPHPQESWQPLAQGLRAENGKQDAAVVTTPPQRKRNTLPPSDAGTPRAGDGGPAEVSMARAVQSRPAGALDAINESLASWRAKQSPARGGSSSKKQSEDPHPTSAQSPSPYVSQLFDLMALDEELSLTRRGTGATRGGGGTPPSHVGLSFPSTPSDPQVQQAFAAMAARLSVKSDSTNNTKTSTSESTTATRARQWVAACHRTSLSSQRDALPQQQHESRSPSDARSEELGVLSRDGDHVTESEETSAAGSPRATVHAPAGARAVGTGSSPKWGAGRHPGKLSTAFTASKTFMTLRIGDALDGIDRSYESSDAGLGSAPPGVQEQQQQQRPSSRRRWAAALRKRSVGPVSGLSGGVVTVLSPLSSGQPPSSTSQPHQQPQEQPTPSREDFSTLLSTNSALTVSAVGFVRGVTPVERCRCCVSPDDDADEKKVRNAAVEGESGEGKSRQQCRRCRPSSGGAGNAGFGALLLPSSTQRRQRHSLAEGGASASSFSRALEGQAGSGACLVWGLEEDSRFSLRTLCSQALPDSVGAAQAAAELSPERNDFPIPSRHVAAADSKTSHRCRDASSPIRSLAPPSRPCSGGSFPPRRRSVIFTPTSPCVAGLPSCAGTAGVSSSPLHHPQPPTQRGDGGLAAAPPPVPPTGSILFRGVISHVPRVERTARLGSAEGSRSHPRPLTTLSSDDTGTATALSSTSSLLALPPLPSQPLSRTSSGRGWPRAYGLTHPQTLQPQQKQEESQGKGEARALGTHTSEAVGLLPPRTTPSRAAFPRRQAFSFRTVPSLGTVTSLDVNEANGREGTGGQGKEASAGLATYTLGGGHPVPRRRCTSVMEEQPPERQAPAQQAPPPVAQRTLASGPAAGSRVGCYNGLLRSLAHVGYPLTPLGAATATPTTASFAGRHTPPHPHSPLLATNSAPPQPPHGPTLAPATAPPPSTRFERRYGTSGEARSSPPTAVPTFLLEPARSALASKQRASPNSGRAVDCSQMSSSSCTSGSARPSLVALLEDDRAMAAPCTTSDLVADIADPTSDTAAAAIPPAEEASSVAMPPLSSVSTDLRPLSPADPTSALVQTFSLCPTPVESVPCQSSTPALLQAQQSASTSQSRASPVGGANCPPSGSVSWAHVYYASCSNIDASLSAGVGVLSSQTNSQFPSLTLAAATLAANAAASTHSSTSRVTPVRGGTGPHHVPVSTTSFLFAVPSPSSVQTADGPQGGSGSGNVLIAPTEPLIQLAPTVSIHGDDGLGNLHACDRNHDTRNRLRAQHKRNHGGGGGNNHTPPLRARLADEAEESAYSYHDDTGTRHPPLLRHPHSSTIHSSSAGNRSSSPVRASRIHFMAAEGSTSSSKSTHPSRHPAGTLGHGSGSEAPRRAPHSVSGYRVEDTADGEGGSVMLFTPETLCAPQQCLLPPKRMSRDEEA